MRRRTVIDGRTRRTNPNYLALEPSDTERALLGVLAERGPGPTPIAIPELCTRVGRSKPAVLRALDHLEGRGLIARERTAGGVGKFTRFRVLRQGA
jgi:predicted transcriptional regulator